MRARNRSVTFITAKRSSGIQNESDADSGGRGDLIPALVTIIDREDRAGA